MSKRALLTVVGLVVAIGGCDPDIELTPAPTGFDDSVPTTQTGEPVEVDQPPHRTRRAKRPSSQTSPPRSSSRRSRSRSSRSPLPNPSFRCPGLAVEWTSTN